MRGARPTKAIEEAQRCAEKMGYHWIKKYRTYITIRCVYFPGICHRNQKDPACTMRKLLSKKIFPDEVEGLRALPLPLHVLREIWIRTQNERQWRRFYIFPDTTGEIGFNRAEDYINPHFRKDEWEASLNHVIARYSIKYGKLEK